MCPHIWKKVNDVMVCVRCGITKIPAGELIFDYELPDYIRKPKKRKKKKK